MSPFTRTFLRPAGDALLLLATLTIANLLIGRTDPGWLHYNPTPYLLVPVLVGARYGFAIGLTAAAATVGAILCGRYYILGESPGAAVEAHKFTLAALPILGAISGELRRIYAAKMRSLQATNHHLQSDTIRLTSEVDLLRESNREIRHQSALHGVELAAIDIELRDILTSGDAGIFGNTLDYLRRTTGVEEAVLVFKNKSAWVVASSSVRGKGTLKIDQLGTEMAESAIKENDLVTWAALWGSEQNAGVGRQSSPAADCSWLAAVPWTDAGSGQARAVLLIKTMPLHRATWDNFAKISTICRWVAGLAVARVTDTGALAAAASLGSTPFRNFLALANETATGHRIPSAILVLRPASGFGAKEVEAEISAALRPTDIFTRAKGGAGSLYCVLLPLAGQRDAAEVANRIGAATGQIITLDGNTSAEDIWKNLTDGKQIAVKAQKPGGPGTGVTPRVEPI